MFARVCVKDICLSFTFHPRATWMFFEIILAFALIMFVCVYISNAGADFPVKLLQ